MAERFCGFYPISSSFHRARKEMRGWLLLLSPVAVHLTGGQRSLREHCSLKATPPLLYGTPVDGSVLLTTPPWPFKGTCDSVADLNFFFNYP